ncbi:MAG: hypothetical protein PW788_01310 [Micavibrio sp.]|nr:hypothetical protein [Micavibrio sp.]
MSNMEPNNKDENIGSFYMNRPRPPEPEQRRLLPRGLLTVLTVVAFAAVIWYAYPQSKEKFSDVDIPTITAEKSPYKFKPEDPGGMDVPHQDSTVFDPIEKKSADSVEHLRPGTEEPVDKDAAIKAAPVDKDKPASTTADARMKDVSSGTEKVVPSNEQPPKVINLKNKAADDVATDTKAAAPAKVTEDADKEIPAEPEVKPAQAILKGPDAPPPVPADPAPETPREASAQVAKGNVFLQFGAFRDTGAANTEWARLQAKFPEQMKGLTQRLQNVNTAKGVLVRLQAERIPEAKAHGVCDAITKTGAACIIVP